MALSFLVYHPRLNEIIRVFDVLSLVPEWQFFAPNPGRYDYHLLFRDVFADGSMSDWSEIPVINYRHWWHFIWNPGKRRPKALFDALSEFGKRVEANDTLLTASIPYLTILNYVSSLERSIPAKSVQFLVMYSQAYCSPPEVLILSNVHGLEQC